MARRHTSSHRARPTAPSDPDDVFLESTFAFSTWAERNRQTLILIGIALAAVLSGSLYYLNYRRTHLERAAVELERVHQGVAFGDTTTAKMELAQYLESFGNTRYGDEARLLLGQLYLESDQPDQAAMVLEEAADVSEPLGLQAAVLLASARVQQGQLQDAEALLLRVANRAELDFQVRGALEEAALLRSVQGDLTGAIELYRRILQDIEEVAPDRGVYEMRVEELLLRSQQG